jgi:hypothetical protein
MKTLLMTASMILTISSSAYAEVLKCAGPIHSVEIDSTANTIQVLPEMNQPADAVIAEGPEDGLKLVFDQAQTFAVFLKLDSEGSSGILQSSTDEDLEEEMNCEGSL